MDLLTSLKRTIKNFPASPAIVDGNTRYNWVEYDRRSSKLAVGLQNLGIAPGDRVAILALNGFRYAEYNYGAIRMGAILVPLNTRFAAPEYIYTLNDSGAVALLVDRNFAELAKKISSELKTVKHIIYAADGDTPDGMISYEKLLEEADGWSSFQDFAAKPDDLVGIYYTGGTTGFPKGVMLSHQNLCFNSLQIQFGALNPESLVYLHAAPMFHLADGGFFYSVCFLGGCHTFSPTFVPQQVLEIIQREKVTHSVWVPTMINAIVNVPNLQEYDLSSLKKITYGASPIPVEVLRKAAKVLPCEFSQAYGMTEASPVLTFLNWKTHQAALEAEEGSMASRRLASCGQPIVGVEVQIVDENGHEVAIGEIGEIIARGPNITRGYWNKAEETAYGLREGWLHTGDLAYRDDSNFYYVVDRKKDMIISGGENIYSTEVENAIYAHPAVLEAAVIGVPDSKWGERVHGVVVLKPGQQADSEEIIESCRQMIASYKVPRSLEFIEALPKSGAGKILKRTLREKYWAVLDRKVN